VEVLFTSLKTTRHFVLKRALSRAAEVMKMEALFTFIRAILTSASSLRPSQAAQLNNMEALFIFILLTFTSALSRASSRAAQLNKMEALCTSLKTTRTLVSSRAPSLAVVLKREAHFFFLCAIKNSASSQAISLGARRLLTLEALFFLLLTTLNSILSRSSSQIAQLEQMRGLLNLIYKITMSDSSRVSSQAAGLSLGMGEPFSLVRRTETSALCRATSWIAALLQDMEAQEMEALLR
jgi:hypothetical protein